MHQAFLSNSSIWSSNGSIIERENSNRDENANANAKLIWDKLWNPENSEEWDSKWADLILIKSQIGKAMVPIEFERPWNAISNLKSWNTIANQ